MFKRRKDHRVAALNTTSTSDISFMLLIFFLVTTSIDSEKGLMRRMPPPPDKKQHTELTVQQRNMLRVAIDADGRVTCEDSTVTLSELRKRVETFVENRDNESGLPEKHMREIPLLGRCVVTDGHVIALEVDRKAGYDTYFHVQETIVGAYAALRDRLARQRFGQPYEGCSPEQREAIQEYYPQRISEAEPAEKGGRS